MNNNSNNLEKVSWEPMKEGFTFDFLQYKLVIDNNTKAILKKTISYKTLLILLLFIGADFFNYILFIIESFDDIDLINISYRVIPFIIIVFLFFVKFQKIVFDQLKGFYWKGKEMPMYMPGKDNQDICPLSSIIALQKLATGAKNKEHYQVNLVLRDHSRLHVCCYNDKESIDKDINSLAKFLHLPVWEK